MNEGRSIEAQAKAIAEKLKALSDERALSLGPGVRDDQADLLAELAALVADLPAAIEARLDKYHRDTAMNRTFGF